MQKTSLARRLTLLALVMHSLSLAMAVATLCSPAAITLEKVLHASSLASFPSLLSLELTCMCSSQLEAIVAATKMHGCCYSHKHLPQRCLRCLQMSFLRATLITNQQQFYSKRQLSTANTFMADSRICRRIITYLQ